MKKASTKSKPIKVSARTRQLYKQRDRRLDGGLSSDDVPQLSPAVWAKGTIGKYYRPLKTQISVRVDRDVLDWLKSQGPGHLTRINAILRRQMESKPSR
ncbi:MAG: hypothetical protein EXQ56_01450 [Acidobacteria bacterium]|nr:hypothetical protein [Acidobacteriota bacterium]